MRLTCPNCDAQYEVPDDVVPTQGRDVQCSNCGQTWFQHHPDHVPEDEDSGLESDVRDPDEEVAPPPEPEHTPETDDDAIAASASDDDDQDDDQDDEGPPSAAPVRKEIDPAVADILREEAEAEAEARRKRQSNTLESQPDLGLPDTQDSEETDRRTLEARKRMARMRGEPEPMSDADVNAAAISSRRDLLPDIEEINSTLRTDNDRSPQAAGQAQIENPTATRQKRGFRRGFLMVLVLFVILALIYAYAPRIAQAAPPLDSFLTAYVAWVDQMRLMLDGWVQRALRWLDVMASQSGE